MSNGLETSEGRIPDEGIGPEVVGQKLIVTQELPLLKPGGEIIFPNSIRQRFMQAVGVAAITAASVIAAITSSEQKSTEAKEPNFPDPAPRKPLELKGRMLSQPAQITDWTDSLGRLRIWGEIDNFRPGTGPNNPDRRMGTVPDRANGVLLWSFQGKDALYPETARGYGVSVLINGLAVFGNRGVLATAVMVSSDGAIYRGCGEFIPDNNNPLDYDSRFAFCEGLPTWGPETYGSVFTSFASATDANGRYIDAGIEGSGIYRHRFDSQGKPVGIWNKIKDAYYLYFPTILKGFPN